MAANGFESLGDALKRLGVTIPDPLDMLFEAEEPPAVGCLRCKDAGWLSRNGAAVECPCGVVMQLRTKRVFSQSQVPLMMREWTLESFAVRSGKQQLADDIRAMWDTTDRWLLLTGPVGVGKTGIAVSLLNEQLARGDGGIYVVAPTLLSIIRSTYDDNDEHMTEATVMTTLIQTPLLLLDDLGKAKLTMWGQEKLYTLISERYGARRRTIVTSNHGTNGGEIEDYLGAAAWDRLRGASEVFEISGASLR